LAAQYWPLAMCGMLFRGKVYFAEDGRRINCLDCHESWVNQHPIYTGARLGMNDFRSKLPEETQCAAPTAS
jgi:hypothetical protein